MAILEDVHTGYRYLLTWSNQNSNGYFDSNYILKTFVRNKKREGVRLSNHNSVIANHQDAATDYYRWEQQAHGVDTSASLSYRANDGVTGSLSVNGCIAMHAVGGDFLGPIYPAIPDDKFNLLFVRFLNKVGEVNSLFDGGQNLGELRATLHGIAHPAKGLWDGMFSYLDTLKRRCRAVRNISNLTRTISSTYLEYANGWKPLVMAINDAGKALNERLDNMPSSAKVNVSLPWPVNISEEIPGYSDPNAWFHWNGRHVFVGERKLKFWAIVRRDVGRPGRFMENMGIAPRHFIPTVWNLLPLSYVADYFVNISSCLTAGGVCTDNIISVGLTDMYSGLSDYHFIGDSTYSDILFRNAGLIPSNIRVGDSSAFFRHVMYRRSRMDKDNLPLVIPTINIPALSTQWFNMAALTEQRTNVSEVIRRLMRR